MVRSLLVVNYPTISAFDFAWIQSVRKQHDELYLQVIDPHFTLVFPAFNFLEAPFINHLQQVTQQIQAFDFVIRCAVLSNDVFSQYTHVFLVPDEGYSNIVKLHDRLYTGVLTKELRQDIPFIPHIGIANSRNPQECKRVVDELNAQSFEIVGRVEKLDVIWYENNRVGTIEKITLVHSDK